MLLAPERFPTTTAWLSGLPHDVESYPDVRVRTEAHDGLRTLFVEAGVSDLPQPFQGFVDGRFRGEWMSEVLGNALLLMARDRIFDSDAAFLEWVAANMDALTRKPLYRMMLRLFSPSLTLSQTEARWAAFHRGTRLTAGSERRAAGRRRTLMTLEHPAGLYHPLLLRNLATLFHVVLEASRAADVQVEPKAASETRSEFQLSWRA